MYHLIYYVISDISNVDFWAVLIFENIFLFDISKRIIFTYFLCCLENTITVNWLARYNAKLPRKGWIWYFFLSCTKICTWNYLPLKCYSIYPPDRHSTVLYINLPIGFNCSFSEGTKMPFKPILTSVYNRASKMLKKSYRWEYSLDLRIILEMLRFMQMYMHLAVKVFILIYLSPISILLYVIQLLSAFVSDMYHHSESPKENCWWKEVGFFHTCQ